MSKTPSEHRTQPSRNLGVAFLIIGLFLIGAVVIFYLSNAQEKALGSSGFTLPPAMADYAAPQLSLTGLDGNPVSLDDYRGKVVLINNWATWCPPCKSEMPELQVYYATHAKDGFVIVAIESGEPAKTVSDFVQHLGLTFPILLDPQSAALEAFQNWDLPSTYVIDRDGIVRMSWTGPLNLATLEKYVTPLLEK
jgi:peroxiredoxin